VFLCEGEEMNSARKLRNSIFLLIVLTFGLAAFAADVDGTWTATINTPMGDMNYTYNFKADGNKLTGTAKNDMAGEVQLKDGVINGSDISFTENLDFGGQAIEIKYKGKVSGDKIEFDREVGTFANEKLVATRKK
jgi:hypothetical protein